MTQPQALLVVDCVGDGRARGRAHGEAMRPRIHEGLERWKDALGANGKKPVDRFVEDLVLRSPFLATGERRTPDLLQEIRGIAEGSALPEIDVVAYNLMDEQWWFDPAGPVTERGCSVIGVTGDGEIPTVVAQNMDLPRFMDGSQVILRVRSNDAPEALVLSAAGLIGLTGVNRAGVAVCVNALLMLTHSDAGLPVALMVRHLLTHPTLSEAVTTLRSTPHASGQHYAIADATSVVGFECSAGDVVQVDPDTRGVLAHTNHPLESADVDVSSEERLEQIGSIKSSQLRLGFLKSASAMTEGSGGAKRLLADRTVPISVSAGDERATLTFGSVVYEMSHPPNAQFCLGRPSAEEWLEIQWVTDE
jgi:isopenicillin-N N-acyltransferase-like protein